MNKLLKLFTTALMLAFVVFLFAGCGDENPTKTKGSTSKTTKDSAAAVSGGKVEKMINQVVAVTDQTPNDFKKALEARRPVVVSFYLTGPGDDAQVRTSVQGLKSRYGGRVDFFEFLFSDSVRYGDLPVILKVSTSPSVVIINGQSQVQIAWSGWVDSQSIEQGIVEALSTPSR